MKLFFIPGGGEGPRSAAVAKKTKTKTEINRFCPEKKNTHRERFEPALAAADAADAAAAINIY